MAKSRRKRASAARKFTIFVLLVVCAVALILYLSCNGKNTASETATVEISEVMTSNKGAVPDENGDFPDWIELHNRTDTAQDISGYGLTDSYPSAAKWTFPNNTVIEPGGYLVVYCESGASSFNEPLSTGFGLSKWGETLLLSGKYYNLLMQLVLPELKSDVSYAALPPVFVPTSKLVKTVQR